MPNLAMRQPATQYARGGVEVSWPLGGEREIVEVPDELMTLDVKRRIADGQIVIVDDAPTKKAGEGEVEYRLLTGEEAREHMAEPAGPVFRTVYRLATVEEGGEEQLVEEQVAVQEARLNSEAYTEAQRAAAEAAEEKSAAIVKAQVEAEEAAAKAAEEAEEPEPDPIQERIQQAAEASVPFLEAQDKAFLERELERQKQESADIPELDTSDEPDTTAADEAFMAAEEARQKLEAEEQEARQAEAEAAAEAAEEEIPTAVASTTDPAISISTAGRRADVGVIANPESGVKSHQPKATRIEATTEEAPKKRGRKPKAAAAEESTESTTE